MNLNLFIINVLIQTSVIILVGWGAVKLLNLKSPPLKYGIWLAVLIGVILCPLFSITAQNLGLTFFDITSLMPVGSGRIERVPQELNISEQGVQPLQPTRLQKDDVTPAPMGTHHEILIGSSTGINPFIYLVIVWIIGSVFFLIRLIYGWLVLWRLKRELREPKEEIISAGKDVQKLLEMKHAPLVKTSTKIGSPLSVGLLRPMVILPTLAISALDEKQIRDILIHECAHITHRDHIVGFLQRLVQIIFWFNPLVYVMNHRLAQVREEICDNYVLNISKDSVAYAKCLVDLIEQTTSFYRMPATIGLIHPRWRLEDRISGLLRKERNMMTKLNTAAIGTLAVALITTLGVVAGCGILMAKEGANEKINQEGELQKIQIQIFADRGVILPDGEKGGAVQAYGTEKQNNGSEKVIWKTFLWEFSGFKSDKNAKVLDLNDNKVVIDFGGAGFHPRPLLYYELDRNTGAILRQGEGQDEYFNEMKKRNNWYTLEIKVRPPINYNGPQTADTTIVPPIEPKQLPTLFLRAAIRIESQDFVDKSITDPNDIATILDLLDFSDKRREPCACEGYTLDFVLTDDIKTQVNIDGHGWNYIGEKGNIRLLKNPDKDNHMSSIETMFKKGKERRQIEPKQVSISFLRAAIRIESQHQIFAGKSITSAEDISAVVDILEASVELPAGVAVESKGYVLYFIFKDGKQVKLSVTESDWNFLDGGNYRTWKNPKDNPMAVIRNLFNKQEKESDAKRVVDGLKVTAQINQPTFKKGDKFILTVEWENTGSKEIVVERELKSNPLMTLDIKGAVAVRIAAGSEEWWQERRDNTPVKIKPGQKVVIKKESSSWHMAEYVDSNTKIKHKELQLTINEFDDVFGYHLALTSGKSTIIIATKLSNGKDVYSNPVTFEIKDDDNQIKRR